MSIIVSWILILILAFRVGYLGYFTFMDDVMLLTGITLLITTFWVIVEYDRYKKSKLNLYLVSSSTDKHNVSKYSAIILTAKTEVEAVRLANASFDIPMDSEAEYIGVSNRKSYQIILLV